MFSTIHELEMQAFCSVSEIDYDYVRSQQQTVSSLKELCANEIVSSGVLLRINCHDLPQELRNFLIHCAISNRCRTSISSLLNTWRHKVFAFEPPVPLGTWVPFVMPYYYNFEATRSKLSSVLTFIVHCVLASLTSFCEKRSQIQCLDLSAFPMDNHYLPNICCHIINYYRFHEDRNKDLTSDETKSSPGVQYLPNKCVIKISCVIHTRCDLLSLLWVLKNIAKGNKYVDLVFTGVHIVYKYAPSESVSRVLDGLQPETLDAFSCFLSPRDCYEHIKVDIIQKLGRFHNLRALNFHVSPLNHLQHSRLISKLRKLLPQLKNLKHFFLDQCDLLNSWMFPEFHVDQSVPLTLCSISGQLERLAIMGSKIIPEDFEYLSLSPQALALRTLNLSHSTFGLKSFMPLLRACKNLRVLRLGGCEFLDGNIDHLFQTFSAMKKLKCLDIWKVHMTSEDLLSQAAYISCMPSLQYLIISPGIQESDSPREFLQKFRSAVRMLRNGSLVCPIMD